MEVKGCGGVSEGLPTSQELKLVKDWLFPTFNLGRSSLTVEGRGHDLQPVAPSPVY